MRMKITAVMTIVSLSILTGCGSEILTPSLTPIEVTPSKAVRCGKITPSVQGDRVCLSRAAYRCMQRQTKTCLYDRKRLIVANEAMVRQIEITGAQDGE